MADTIRVEVLAEGCYLVVLSGPVSFSNNQALQAALDNVLAAEPGRLYVDMSAVSFCNSQGFGDLLRAYTRVKRTGGVFGLIAPTPEIRKVLDITKFASIIEVFPDREAALRGTAAT